jgi:hypothetical protein
MKNKDPTKDHKIIESRAVEIDESELNETDRYYPSTKD